MVNQCKSAWYSAEIKTHSTRSFPSLVHWRLSSCATSPKNYSPTYPWTKPSSRLIKVLPPASCTEVLFSMSWFESSWQYLNKFRKIAKRQSPMCHQNVQSWAVSSEKENTWNAPAPLGHYYSPAHLIVRRQGFIKESSKQTSWKLKNKRLLLKTSR